MRKKININLLILLFLILTFYFTSQNLMAQDLVLGLSLGYSNVFLNYDMTVDILSQIPEPALAYEIFSYLFIPISNNLDFILGISLISKGFSVSGNQKYELIYFSFFVKLRILFFKNTYSKNFIEIGLNPQDTLLTNFILDYSSFTISDGEINNFKPTDFSFNIGTGIIIKNIILSLNLLVQADGVLYPIINQTEYKFSNYVMVISIGFIL